MTGDRFERPAFEVVSDDGYDRPQAVAATIDADHEVARLVEEARRRVDCLAEEVEAAAERGAVAVMINSQPQPTRSAGASISQMLSVRPSVANFFCLGETLDGLAVEMLRAG